MHHRRITHAAVQHVSIQRCSGVSTTQNRSRVLTCTTAHIRTWGHHHPPTLCSASASRDPEHRSGGRDSVVKNEAPATITRREFLSCLMPSPPLRRCDDRAHRHKYKYKCRPGPVWCTNRNSEWQCRDWSKSNECGGPTHCSLRRHPELASLWLHTTVRRRLGRSCTSGPAVGQACGHGPCAATGASEDGSLGCLAAERSASV